MVCRVFTGKCSDNHGRGAGHHPGLSGWYLSGKGPTDPALTASRVGSRLRFPVVFLDRDGTALLLPGAAVRTRLFRHCLAVFICAETIRQVLVSSGEKKGEGEKRGGLGGGGLGSLWEGHLRSQSGWVESRWGL